MSVWRNPEVGAMLKALLVSAMLLFPVSVDPQQDDKEREALDNRANILPVMLNCYPYEALHNYFRASNKYMMYHGVHRGGNGADALMEMWTDQTGTEYFLLVIDKEKTKSCILSAGDHLKIGSI